MWHFFSLEVLGMRSLVGRPRSIGKAAVCHQPLHSPSAMSQSPPLPPHSSIMSTVPGDYQEQTFGPVHHSHALWNTHSSNTLTNNVGGSLNTNVGNVSHSYNNTFHLGPGEGTLPIQAWLSPLESHKRHQDVRNLRLDGIGDWVLWT